MGTMTFRKAMAGLLPGAPLLAAQSPVAPRSLRTFAGLGV
jgi:hypothetical protein